MKKEEMGIVEMEWLVNEMKRLKSEHPKAKVIYDWERERIFITYPLPADFERLQGLSPERITKDEFKL